MKRLPSSPSRLQALVQFEPLLLKAFDERASAISNPDVRDAMHYALFSVKDRFCTSSAWLIAPRLGLDLQALTSTICAIETLRCSLLMKMRQPSSLEPSVVDAASYGLIPMAFEMVLTPNDYNPVTQQAAIAAVIAKTCSPVRFLSAPHRGSRERATLQGAFQNKVEPAFRATGEALGLFLKERTPSALLAQWFERLGLFVYLIEDFILTATDVPLADSIDLIKSLEAELLESAKSLSIQGAAHEILEPLGDMLKTRLQ